MGVSHKNWPSKKILPRRMYVTDEAKNDKITWMGVSRKN